MYIDISRFLLPSVNYPTKSMKYVLVLNRRLPIVIEILYPKELKHTNIASSLLESPDKFYGILESSFPSQSLLVPEVQERFVT